MRDVISIKCCNSCNTGWDLIIYIGLLAGTCTCIPSRVNSTVLCDNKIVFCYRIFDRKRI